MFVTTDRSRSNHVQFVSTWAQRTSLYLIGASRVLELTNTPRANVTSAEAGQCVSLALKRMRRAAVRKGMVLVHKSEILPRG